MNKQIFPKSLSQYLVVQAIFNQAFGFDKKEVEYNFIKNCDLTFHIDLDYELSKEKFDKVFFKRIFNNVFKNEDIIGKLISQNLNESWQFTRLPNIIQAILKVAISEMITYPKTSIGIIATEYLRLAESFNIETENSFINAILDKVHKELESNG